MLAKGASNISTLFCGTNDKRKLLNLSTEASYVYNTIAVVFHLVKKTHLEGTKAKMMAINV